ncbi:MAG: serine hydrolase domain-containing protein [Reyranellaceae bacterium]
MRQGRSSCRSPGCRLLKPLCIVAAALVFHSVGSAQTPASPVFSKDGPDAAAYGVGKGYPLPGEAQRFAILPQEYLVGFYSHFDLLRAVSKGDAVVPLMRAISEINPVYGYDGRIKSITDYLHAHPVTGLLIARDDTILYEHYQYARSDRDRFMSQSMAKTVLGMLIGIALSEGSIRSLDDVVANYVPELADTAYGATPIRALLQMSSGIAYRETYEPDDDSRKLGAALFPPNAEGAIASIRQFNVRVAAPGTTFNYSSADSEVLGLVLSRAVHMSIAEYLSSRIWRKLGTEADAGWATDPQGQEITFCCMVATLRDWARFALMLAHDGKWNGQQIVPRQWIIDSTTVPPNSYLAPGRLSPILGYGYQTWISAGERRRFSLIGIQGQTILIDPVTKMVLVHTAVRLNSRAGPDNVEIAALWYAVLAQYGPR